MMGKGKRLGSFAKWVTLVAKLAGAILGVVAIAFLATVLTRTYKLHRPDSKNDATTEEIMALNALLNTAYPNDRGITKALPYKVQTPTLTIGAKSAIVVDNASGCILFEKNADEVIPPASITKLFVMYLTMESLERGDFALGTKVTLHDEALARNMMPHSSLMFLSDNQDVTVEDLVTGLCVDSGNDAAYALAFFIIENEDKKAGRDSLFDAKNSMERFVKKMNDVAQRLGLTHTHFVEASGYSEENLTTARELATFCVSYVTRFPGVLKYHSTQSFTWSNIYQANTNPLLGKLPGCDGIKTGFIFESGYNLALTVKRGEERIVAVTLGGEGANAREGNAGRVNDHTALTDYAYNSFYIYHNELLMKNYSVPLINSAQTRVNLVPAYRSVALPIPRAILTQGGEERRQVKIDINIDKYIAAPFEAGVVMGQIVYSCNGHLLQTIPLVTQKAATKSNWWLTSADFFSRLSL